MLSYQIMDSLEVARDAAYTVKYYQSFESAAHMPSVALSLITKQPAAYVREIKYGSLGASTHMTTISGSWNDETKAYLNLGIGERVFDSWPVRGPFMIELVSPIHIRNMFYSNVTLDFYNSPTTVSMQDSLTRGRDDAPTLMIRQLEGIEPVTDLRYLLNSRGEIYVTVNGFAMTLAEYQEIEVANVRGRVERLDELEGSAK